jgi:pimeloyl-ACP methyl ester carboxylesterase
MAIMSRPDSRPDLPKIKCPTLVLVGEGDQLTPPKLSEEIASGIRNSRLVVVRDSGHLSTLERPDAVNTALVEWMNWNA